MPAESGGPTPLAGRRVVITRSVEDNRPLARRLRALGAEVVEAPMVEVAAPADGGRALAAAVDRLARYRWVVLTSVNGVRALADALAGRCWPAGVAVAPVGPATEAAARAAGMAVVPAAEVATAAGLVAGFPAWVGPGGRRVLAPLAELAGDTVVEGLAAKGWLVDRVTAYRTAAPDGPAPEGAAAGPPGGAPAGPAATAGADAVLFFSPSAVDRFVDRFADRPGVPPIVVCIGPSTGARAVGRGLAGALVARPHSEDGVIAALVAALG